MKLVRIASSAIDRSVAAESLASVCPILFAGTCSRYSTKAKSQDNTMAFHIGQSLYFKCKYHAAVMTQQLQIRRHTHEKVAIVCPITIVVLGKLLPPEKLINSFGNVCQKWKFSSQFVCDGDKFISQWHLHIQYMHLKLPRLLFVLYCSLVVFEAVNTLSWAVRGGQEWILIIYLFFCSFFSQIYWYVV